MGATVPGGANTAGTSFAPPELLLFLAVIIPGILGITSLLYYYYL
jgi:hypothetical protein